jgi:PAS domain-containing protein
MTMTIKQQTITAICLLFTGCTLILYFLDKLQADRTSTLHLPFALWSGILMVGLLLATLGLIYRGCKQYRLLLEKSSAELADTTRSLLETQSSLEETVERRTFELAVVNGSLHREIAERIQTETESKKLQQRFEIILDSAGEGIFGIDTKGNVTFINKTASRLLGWRPQILSVIRITILYITPIMTAASIPSANARFIWPTKTALSTINPTRPSVPNQAPVFPSNTPAPLFSKTIPLPAR